MFFVCGKIGIPVKSHHLSSSNWKHIIQSVPRQSLGMVCVVVKMVDICY
jgi:hypothetical protein